MVHGDVTMALLLYFLFAVVCVVSAFFIAAHFHSRRLGALMALGVAAFFALLMVGLFMLVRSA